MHVKWMKAAFVIVLCVGMMPVMAVAGQSAQPDKLDPVLRQTLVDSGSSDLIVEFTQQADLSAAYGMDWVARGEYVVNTLRAVAKQVQAPAIAVMDRHGIRHETFIAGNELYVYGADLNAALDLTALPNVAYVRVPGIYYVDPIITQTPSPMATTDWGITDTKADQFWTTFGLQGDGIVVANIDTGVQWNHPALVNAFKCPNAPTDPKCWKDPGNYCGAGGACDNNGHGTHTMGTMVADDNASLTYIAGMAPNAKWIACKGCGTSSCSDADLNACADWILAPGGNAANRPNVVNNSWGGGGNDAWYQAKVQSWRAAGIFPAFSAGNSGSSCSTLGSPGDYQESFASAAHGSSRTIASYSSRGPSAYGHTPYTKPNISAPGSLICSTVPTNGWSCGYSGTSMASPHTAGAVALLWSCNPSLVGQIDQTFQLLQNNTDSPPAGNCGSPGDGGNYTYGYGYLNVLKVGQAGCNITPTPPAAPTSLVATAATDTQINLTWTDNANNESGFEIERSPNGSTWALHATVGANTTSYSDTGLTPNTTYYYRVRAYNANGYSAYSNVASATTLPTASKMHVESIVMSYVVSGKNRTVTAKITINDASNNPVSGASVAAQWTLPNGSTKNQTATTAVGGVATFNYTWKKGTYQICVTNVTKAGYTYDPAGNHITCNSISAP